MHLCPAASETIAEQQKLYGADKLIAVAFHAGPLAIKSGTGFVGCALMWVMSIISIGLFQMCQKPLSIVVEGVLSKDTWAGRIYEEFAQTTTVNIDLNVSMLLQHVRWRLKPT